MSDEEYDHIIK